MDGQPVVDLMRISGPWLDSEAARLVHDTLAAAEFRALFVGGAVRNTVLGLPAGDIDIATDASPEQAAELLGRTGAKLAMHGFQFGTLTVIHRSTVVQLTSFRRDIETDGRHARIAGTSRIEEDAARRDFTMNAIYADWDGSLIDPLGGLQDLLARRVRFVGSARERIMEDYLRMLRLFRFHAHYGDPSAPMEHDGLQAVAELVDGIGIVSAERITAEFLKTLAAADPFPAIDRMAGTGLLSRILSGASTRHLDRAARLEKCFQAPPDPLRRLAALGDGHATSQLRLDRKSERRLRMLMDETCRSRTAAELGYRFGVRDGLDIAILGAARSGTRPDDNLPAAIDLGAAQRFPLSASSLPASLAGKAIGKALRDLEDRWIESGFSLSADELLAGLNRR